MKTISDPSFLPDACIPARSYVANELQNEINQVLASALLWLRHAKTENKLTEDIAIRNAELNLKEAIERVRALHLLLVPENTTT